MPLLLAGVRNIGDLINPDSLEMLRSHLINLPIGQDAYISGDDFKKLTGCEITEFASEGRLMMGNLAALANCTIDTANGSAIFTKNLTSLTADIAPRSPHLRPLGATATDPH
jgi:hypothetical protein